MIYTVNYTRARAQVARARSRLFEVLAFSFKVLAFSFQSACFFTRAPAGSHAAQLIFKWTEADLLNYASSARRPTHSSDTHTDPATALAPCKGLQAKTG